MIKAANNLILPAVLVLTLLSGTAFSYAPLSISVSPNTTITLDYNQSSVNFNAIVSGGVPFGPQNNSYVYQWTVQKNSTCPGFSTLYPHQRGSLLYLPNGTTSLCAFRVQVSDNTGNSAFASTANVVVNQKLSSIHTLSKSNYTIYQGQNVTISMGTPTGGTLPYHYQWFASTSLVNSLNAPTANSLCLLANNGLTCIFKTSSLTAPGIYGFQLNYWDSLTSPVSFFSSSILVRVSQSLTSTTSVNSTTTLSTTSSTTIPTTIPTTITTTIAQTPPTTPLTKADAIITNSGETLLAWLKALIGYVV